MAGPGFGSRKTTGYQDAVKIWELVGLPVLASGTLVMLGEAKSHASWVLAIVSSHAQ